MKYIGVKMPSRPAAAMATAQRPKVSDTCTDPCGAMRRASSNLSVLWVTERPIRELRKLARENPEPTSGWYQGIDGPACTERSVVSKTSNLAVDADLVGRATSRLDGVDRVEGAVRSVYVEEVAVQELGQMCQLRLFHILAGAFELVGVAVHTHDLGAGETGDLQQRPPIPQPRSATTIPGPSPSLCAR